MFPNRLLKVSFFAKFISHMEALDSRGWNQQLGGWGPGPPRMHEKLWMGLMGLKILEIWNEIIEAWL